MSKVKAKLETAKIQRIFGKAAGNVIVWTIADTQKTAQRFMKKPGKKAGKGSHSKPGKPPLVHTGALKASVRYDVDVKNRMAIAGPLQYQGRGQGAKALEYGGKVRKKIVYSKRKQKTEPPKKRVRHQVGSRQHPVGKTRTYTYFYSQEAWEKGRNSPNFQRWAKGEPQEAKTVEIVIESRPFMRPALERELRKLPQRWARARQQMKG